MHTHCRYLLRDIQQASINQNSLFKFFLISSVKHRRYFKSYATSGYRVALPESIKTLALSRNNTSLNNNGAFKIPHRYRGSLHLVFMSFLKGYKSFTSRNIYIPRLFIQVTRCRHTNVLLREWSIRYNIMHGHAFNTQRDQLCCSTCREVFLMTLVLL